MYINQHINKNLLNQASFSQNHSSLINSLSFTEISFINYIIRLSNFYKFVDPSQKTIGKRINVTREWSNKLAKKLVNLGILIKKYHHRRTCQYILNPIFLNLEFRKKYVHVFKNLKWLPLSLSLLQSISSTLNINIFKPESSHHLNKSIYLKNINKVEQVDLQKKENITMQKERNYQKEEELTQKEIEKLPDRVKTIIKQVQNAEESYAYQPTPMNLKDLELRKIKKQKLLSLFAKYYPKKDNFRKDIQDD